MVVPFRRKAAEPAPLSVKQARRLEREKAKAERRAAAARAYAVAPWIALGVLLSLWPRKARGLPLPAEALEPGRGRRARSPSEIPPVGWRDVLWRAWREFQADQITLVAGSVAFSAIVALFPALAAFVALYGMFADVAAAREHLALLSGFVPADALTLIGDQLVRIAAARKAGLSATFIGGLLLSFWSANGAIKALVAGLNIAYDEREKRNFLELNLLTMGFTLAGVAFMGLAAAAVIVAPIVLQFFWLDRATGLLANLRWPVLLLISMIGLSAIYRFGPSRETARWQWVTWGGAVAALLWLAGSLLFSWYLSNFAHYNATYGSLGAVFGLLTWLWLSSVIVLFGAELNSEIEHQTAVDSTTGPPLPLGIRGAAVADTVGEAKRGDVTAYLPGFLVRMMGRPASQSAPPPRPASPNALKRAAQTR